MAIMLYDIFSIIKDYSPSLYSIKNGEELIIDAELLNNYTDTFYPNIIYVSKASDINLMGNKKSLKGSFLIEKNVEYDLKKFEEQNIGIIEIPPVGDIQKLFNIVKKMFIEDYQLLNSSRLLLNALVDNKGLKYIIDICSQILNNPLILIDSGFKVLAHSDVKKITDPFWVENINQGYCTYEFVSEVNKNKPLEEPLESNEPYIFICPQSPVRKLVSKVLIDNCLMGYIILTETSESFTANTYKILKTLSDVISEELKKNQNYRNLKSLMYDNLVIDILENSIKNRNVLLDRMKSARVNFGNNLYLLAIDISNYTSSARSSNYMQQSLENLFPSYKSLLFNDNILILLDIKNMTTIDELINDNVKGFIEINNLRLAVSSNFNDILVLNSQYKQVTDTLKLSHMLETKESILYYEDFKLYHLLYNVNYGNHLLDFCNTGLLNLFEYDKTYNTAYVETIKAYIEHNRNCMQAAKNLNIHRNTMNYRLSKIKEITGMRLNNGDELFRLILSIHMLEFHQKRTKYNDKKKHDKHNI